MKTIKQVANELGVSKETVRKQVPNLPPNMVTIGANRCYLISAEGVEIIREKTATTSDNVGDNQVTSDWHSVLKLLEKQNEQLSNELEIKNKQIADLSAAMGRMSESLQAAQALYGGTIQKQLTDGKKDGFFSRWRKK